MHGYHGGLPGASPCHAKIWIGNSTSKYMIINNGTMVVIKNIRLGRQWQHNQTSRIGNNAAILSQSASVQHE
jgi:hypothetical protein